MTLQEAIKSGRPFKRKQQAYWMVVNGSNIIISDGEYNKYLSYYDIDVKDILTKDWIIKEEWYEGDFKSKWPNGVLCWVWDSNLTSKIKMVVIDYRKNLSKPFKTYFYNWDHAEPVKPEEAPAIIES